MKLLNIGRFLFFFFPAFLAAQKQLPQSVKVAEPTSETQASKVIRSSISDSAIVKIEMLGAQYEVERKNYPYFIISRRTAYSQSAIPQLRVKKVQLLPEPHAAVVKKYFSAYVKNEFQLTELASLSGGENRNQYKLYPFRYNALGQIEELLEYDVKWTLRANDYQQKLKNTANFKSSSVLASGSWYKIGITKSGIHKITKAFLISCGIDVNSLDPSTIRIFGNGGQAVPELNAAFRYDDLEECAIKVVDGNDNNFGDSDYILFYGESGEKWTKRYGNGLKFGCQKNIYSDTAFYYINTGQASGKRIATQSAAAPANFTTTTYDYRGFHEVNLVNFQKSGRQFFGEFFDLNSSYTIGFYDGNFVVGDSIMSEVTVAGRHSSTTTFAVSGNGMLYNVLTSGVDLSHYLAAYADVQTNAQRALNTNGASIVITISKQTPAALGWLDMLTVNARRELFLNKQFQFRDTRSSGSGNITTFLISNPAGHEAEIWNVSNRVNPVKCSHTAGGGSIAFTVPADTVHEFVIAPANDYYTPVFVGRVANQNLHAISQADYVIVSHPLFTSHAQRLATLHAQHEGLSWVIVTTDQVYNEFSSGMTDPSAIRDFIRMLYTRNIALKKQPKYVLLFGDGSYDNKNKDIVRNSCFIPTYQTPSSLSPLQTLATDDFYGLMDPNEGAIAESLGSVDIGIGRLIARNTTEAEAMVRKIENYYSRDEQFKIEETVSENCNSNAVSNFGDWRNWVIFLADDEDQSTHQADADKIAVKVKSENPWLNQHKIYMDAYQQFSTPGGERYPDAYADLQKRIKKGALIFNYTGHGGEVGLTSERLVDIESINSWDNFNRLGLFITATCEFTRYDDPTRTSAGEFCILNPRGGAVSMLTTCRLAFSHSNLTLNTTLYDFMFKKLPDGRKPCLGDVIRLTKDTLNQSMNYANFHLIGDPALTLAYPQEKKVVTSAINQKPVGPGSSDTLSALSKVTVTGFVADTLGNKITNFNGIVYPTVFDKEATVKGLLNNESSYYISAGQPFTFKSQKNILYRGKAEVRNGDFSFTFIVPKDISFVYGAGKISYYATNGSVDAGGYFSNVVVGGGTNNAVADYEGPEVKLYLNNKSFVDGGITNEKPVLYAQLTDSSGINMVGTGIGHDLTAVLDGNANRPIVLNDYYEANLNSYQKGVVRYPFEELSEGEHRLTLKVWDIQNNSSTAELDFVVAHSAELALDHVLNYPNPFTTRTKFFVEHNQACEPIKVNIQVFTISGKLVKSIQQSMTCEGFRPDGIEWDGRDDYGDKLARGVYIYRVSVTNSANKRAEKTEKLVILN